MIPQRINNATRELGAPKGWDQTKGNCAALPIRDIKEAYGNRMVSEWRPTVEELALLNGGASILLSVVGDCHPPVSINVGVLSV